MVKKKNTRIFILFVIIIFVLITGLIIIKYLRIPPTTTLKNAYQSISKAKTGHADKYAFEILKEAEKMLALGEKMMQDEGKWWSLAGSYDVIDSLLTEAILKADEATRVSKNYRLTISKQIKHKLDKISADVMEWDQRLSANLTTLENKKIYIKLCTNIEIAQKLISQNQYVEAKFYINQADSLLNNLNKKYEHFEMLKANTSSKEKRWISETLLESKKSRKNAIIIDKSAHKLFLLKEGKVVASYLCNLGYNAAHQKFKSGDGATPEGKYHVSQVKHESKYYKALLLDYPNQTDQYRFKENKRNGVISTNSQIGGLIEIHGGGVLDKDWTDGCIAIENKHMDLILKKVDVGTPVTIVYSSDIGN